MQEGTQQFEVVCVEAGERPQRSARTALVQMKTADMGTLTLHLSEDSLRDLRLVLSALG